MERGPLCKRRFQVSLVDRRIGSTQQFPGLITFGTVRGHSMVALWGAGRTGSWWHKRYLDISGTKVNVWKGRIPGTRVNPVPTWMSSSVAQKHIMGSFKWTTWFAMFSRMFQARLNSDPLHQLFSVNPLTLASWLVCQDPFFPYIWESCRPGYDLPVWRPSILNTTLLIWKKNLFSLEICLTLIIDNSSLC